MEWDQAQGPKQAGAAESGKGTSLLASRIGNRAQANLVYVCLVTTEQLNILRSPPLCNLVPIP
jgi:hypothetical protein